MAGNIPRDCWHSQAKHSEMCLVKCMCVCALRAKWLNHKTIFHPFLQAIITVACQFQHKLHKNTLWFVWPNGHNPLATCLKASGTAFMKQSIINTSADSLFWKHLWIDCKNKQTKRGEKNQLTTGPLQPNPPNELHPYYNRPCNWKNSWKMHCVVIRNQMNIIRIKLQRTCYIIDQFHWYRWF